MRLHFVNQYKKGAVFYNLFSIGWNSVDRPYIIILGLGLELILIKKR